MKRLTYIFSGLFLLDTGSIFLNGVPAVASLRSTGLLEALGYITPIINTVLLICVSWYILGSLYKKGYVGETAELEPARRLGLSMILSIVMIPIIFSPSFLYPYIVGKGLAFRFLALGSFLVFVYLAFRSKAFWPRLTPVVIGCGVFTATMFLSFIFAVDSYRAFWGNYERMEGYISVLCVFMLLIALSSFRLKDMEWRKVFVVHLFISFLVSLIAVLQVVMGKIAVATGSTFIASLPILNLCAANPYCRTDSTLGNSIYLGIYAALSAWIVAYVAIKYKSSKNFLLWTVVILNIIALYFSGTRGSMLGFVFGLFIFGATYLFIKGSKKQITIFLISSTLFVVLFAGTVVQTKRMGIIKNIPVLSKFESTNSIFARLNVWKIAVETYKQNPVLGIGQENFIHGFNKNYNPAMYGQETYFDHPHNTYLGWLTMGGLLGFMSYMLFICMAIFGVFRSYKKEEKHDALGMAIAFGAFATYFFHIFFVFDNLISILAFVFLAVYFGRNFAFGSLVFPSVVKGKEKLLTYSLFALFVIVIYGSWWRPAYANLLTIKALSTQDSNPIKMLGSISNSFERAISLNTFGSYEISELYLQKGLEYKGALPQVQDENLKNIINSIADKSLANFNKEVIARPFDHRSRFMLGLYYTQLADYPNAEKTLTEALNLAPNKQVALLALARVYLLQGKTDPAIALFQKAIEITPKDNINYNELRIQLVQTMMLSGKDKESLQIIQDMLPVSTAADFEKLVYQMGQVLELRKDLKGLITLLRDATNLNPQNANFYLWLAQALAISGDYRGASFEINKLTSVYPQVVNSFNQKLLEASKQKVAAEEVKVMSTSTATATKKK